MAKKLISYDDVAQICEDYVTAGEEPTTMKIHKALGKGSYSTITKYLRQWQQSESAQNQKLSQLPAVNTLPDTFASEAELFLKS